MAGYGNSSQDQRQVFSSSILYMLPFGRGQQFGGNVSRPVDWLIGGWQTSLIALVQTRHASRPLDGNGRTRKPSGPDCVHQVSQEHYRSIGSIRPRSPILPWLPAALSNAATYTRLGTLGRNQVYGPGYRVVNFSLQKNLHLTEKYTLELHGDAFNLFNTPEFTNPNSNLTGGNFGQIEGTQVYSNREIQLAARFTF